MPTLNLKSYQQAALDSLVIFARAAQRKGPAMAFGEQVGRPYNPDPFGEVPCVCLRVPTGGGKTLIAAHAVRVLAAEWCATDAPVALWLVPSDTIRSQTLKALQTTGHPYREALEASYGAGVKVCVLEDLANIPPTDWGQCAVVVVATIQSFRIDDTDKRNVYSFSERFERHFKARDDQQLRALRDLPDAVVTAAEAVSDTSGVLAGFVGQPRWSLANWLALHEPLLIVDEAHNTKTDKSFTALKRLNPSAILELTATPLPAKSNVLFHVSAQELASEAMIKLPIALAEHPQGWQQAVFAAVQSQRALEGEALKDEAAGHGYVRPIVLFQAQNENDEAPPAVLRKHLEDELHIPKDQIKVATGDTRELEGLDLSARDCPVRFVITVQALREGWDCPFAYVMCSLQKLSSATAVEQPLVFEPNRYPVLADLKDGGEEFFCAQMIDNHVNTRHWLRNLTTAPCGFSLATSRGKFYPDFVAELADGRIAIVEYKGAHLVNDPYEIEKRQIGELWARKSQGKCLFEQITKERDGLGTAAQLDALLA
jgi:type III restriction enzyme